MRILFATSEAFPLIKTGGLADVSGALPKALNHLSGVEVKLLLPGYSAVLAKLKSTQTIATIEVLRQTCTLIMGKMPDADAKTDIDVIAIQNTYLYERAGGPYSDENGIEWPDNALRFAVLSKVASLLCSKNSPLVNWQPKLLHCNDWQTGLAPAYMKLVDDSQVKTVLSLHNLAFQGCFDKRWFDALALPMAHFNIEGFEYHDQISFLKAGIFYADQLSTVSPTYAEEIQTKDFGFGLQGLLQTRKNDLIGILNGIDTQKWNPATDAYLPKNYSNSRITGKKAVKAALQKQLELANEADAPLLGVVSRLTHQKGLDLLPNLIPALIEKGCQFAILGSGDKIIEANFVALANAYPAQVSVTIGYNEALSHNIMASCDMFVMPSRFEPCGLNQLYGLAYGTPPIVSNTGGLADSVCDASLSSLSDNSATGFVIESVSESGLLNTITRALAAFETKSTWRKIQKNGMQQALSWDSRAQAYLDLYKKALAISA